jgi:hypothetical protein
MSPWELTRLDGVTLKKEPCLFGADIMDEIIEVIAYSGYRGEEVPRVFLLHDKRVEVSDTLDTWVEENFASKVRKRYFKVKGNDGDIHQIYYNEKALAWFYVKKRKGKNIRNLIALRVISRYHFSLHHSCTSLPFLQRV